MLDKPIDNPEPDVDCIFAEERAKAFVLRHVTPANRATEEAVEALRVELGCQNRAGHKRAICGFLQACKVLSSTDVKTLAFPSSKPAYDDDGGSYKAFMAVKNRLKRNDWIAHERKAAADHGRARIFRLVREPDTEGLEFSENPSLHILRVNSAKTKSVDEHKAGDVEKMPPMRRKTLLEVFGEDKIKHEEQRVRQIVDFLSDHPLRLGGTEYRSLWRIFNNNSLRLGGRLYGGYSGISKKHRPTACIDGGNLSS